MPADRATAKGGEIAPTLAPEWLFPPLSIKARYAGMMIEWYLAARPRALIGRPAATAKTLALFGCRAALMAG